LDTRVGADLLEMARRRGRVSAREQRLGEVQPRVAAAVLGAGLEQFVEIIQLGRSRGAGERLVQIGIAQVNHAEHELRLCPALGEQVTSWFILVPVRTSVLVRPSTSAM